MTAKHIKDGIPVSHACPVALALKDIFQNGEMGVFTLSFNDEDGDFHRIVVPKKVTEFVCRFDDKRPVKPFNFYIKY